MIEITHTLWNSFAEVQFVMPEATRSLLQQQIDCGREGINEVTEAISKVDSAQAKAWKAEDEAKVKSMIQERGKLYKDN